jgi:virginiamycin B lyase
MPRPFYRPELEPLEDRCLPSVTEFPLPGSDGFLSSLHRGPDGSLWYANWGLSSTLGRFDPRSETFQSFPAGDGTFHIEDLTVAPDNTVWYTKVPASGLYGTFPFALVHFDPATAASTSYDLNALPTGIAMGPDGNVWLTQTFSTQGDSGSSLARFDVATHQVTTYPTPTPNSSPGGLVSGPKGTLWFTELTTAGLQPRLGKLDTATGAIREFALPTAGWAIDGLAPGPDGGVWLVQHNVEDAAVPSQLLRFDPAGERFTVVSGYVFGQLQGVAVGPDNAVYVTQARTADDFSVTGTVVRYDVAAQTFTEFALPSAHTLPDLVLTDPDGTVWFSEYNTDTGTVSLARLTPDGGT